MRMPRGLACWRSAARARAAALALALACTAGWAQAPLEAPEAEAQAASPALRLRVLGGLAGVGQYLEHEEPFWAQELARLSGGRYRGEITPFDRAGLQSTEMLRLVQLGVVPFGTLLLSGMAVQYPQFSAIDLPGLNADLASLRANLKAFRPYLETALRTQHGVQVLAVYAYPAQMLFCTRRIEGLASLAGRRIRVASAGQADFVEALGAQPVPTGFAQIVHSIETSDTECAITGSMSGYSLGLYRQTQYLYPLPINWGLAVFAVHQGAWRALPPDLRTLLERELPRLEARIWDAAERDTALGIACNSGAPACTRTPKGRMTLVAVSAQDEQHRREIFQRVVLPRWLQRCSVDCAGVWSHTLGPAMGMPAARP